MTCASEPAAIGQSSRVDTPAALSAPASSCIGAAARLIAAGHFDQQERARVDDDARLGTVGLDADRAGEHACGAEALAQQRDVVEAVQQRQHDRRPAGDPLQRILQAGGLRRDEQRVDRLAQLRRRTRLRDEIAERDAVDAQPALGDQRRRRLARDDASRPRPRARARRRAGRRRRRDRASAIFTPCRAAGLRVDQHAGIHDRARIDRRLRTREARRRRARGAARHTKADGRARRRDGA